MKAKDREILYELDFNAREPLNALAKKLRMKKETLAYRIRDLEKKGIITSYFIVPDSTKMGLVTFKVMLKYQNITSGIERKMMAELKAADEVGWLVKTDGAYDLIFICWVKNEFEFERFFTKFLDSYSKYFYLRDMLIITENHACRKSYLTSRDVEKEEVFYAGKPKNMCDETDLKIINILTKNARESNVNIAKKIGLTPEAVGYRIKQLVKKGVIAKFRPRINLGKLGYYFYNVMFKLRSTSAIPEIFAYAGERKNISYYARYLGGYDIGFDLEVENPEKFREILDEIREKFGRYIINYDYVHIYEEVKITY